ncbi:hypothetical protein BO71DRAFT_468056, partial [Aspergillus ellipticus CBS 707.79]
SQPFFERPLEEKIAECANSGAGSLSRFVPFASEKIRGIAHLDESIEFQHGLYEQPGNWSVSGQELLDASKAFHEECHRIQFHIFDCVSPSLSLSRPLSAIHSYRNTFVAPYNYRFDGDQDTDPRRVPPHIDPATMLFCFQDEYAGLEVADMSKVTRSISTTAVQKADVLFVPMTAQPGEFVPVSRACLAAASRGREALGASRDKTGGYLGVSCELLDGAGFGDEL